MRIENLLPYNSTQSPPLVEVHGLSSARVLGRCEGHSEYGSIKSKMVRYLLLQAMQDGRLRTGDHVIEASSGNTGIALAGIGAELGLKVCIVLLDGTEPNIVHRLEALGAQIFFCDRQAGMRGMLTFIRNNFPNVYTIDQFRNKAIVPAYVQTHGQELLSQLEAADIVPDYLFSCVGTGGTLQGMGTILRQRWPAVRVVAVEKEAAAEPIDGIRNTSVAYFGEADIYDKNFADETVYIDTSPPIPQGLQASQSCAALLEAIRRYPLKQGKNVLAIFCDAQLVNQPSPYVAA